MNSKSRTTRRRGTVMRMLKTTGVLVAALLIVSGCATTRQVNKVDRLGSMGPNPRILLMTPDVKLYLMTASGMSEPQAEWTNAARKNFLDAADAFGKRRKVEIIRMASTLRGMHYQLPPHAEVKIARCTRGAAFDVAIDLRQGSPTYGRWAGVRLTADEGNQVYVPEGCAHGYLTLADDTELVYTASTAYAPGAARGVRHDDPRFAIEWPAPVRVISEPDRSWAGHRAEDAIAMPAGAR